MTPKETVILRAERYASCDYRGVYELYSPRSEFRMYFSDVDMYVEHITAHQDVMPKFISLDILQERYNKNISEVRYMEYFAEGSAYLKYFTRSVLVLENGIWVILREDRETQKYT